MKRLVLYSSFLLSLIGLSFNSIPVQAQPCPKLNNAQSPAYSLREQDKRCEGTRSEDISGDFSLISLTLGQVQPAHILKLQVPDRANGQELKVRVVSKKKNYQLDPLEFHYSGGRFQVQWSDDVIRAAGISLDSLRAIASVSSGSQKVYLPVILSPGSGQYQIVLSNERPAKIPIFQILRNGTVVYSDSRITFQPKGQIKFTWRGRDQAGNPLPAGRYELRVKAELEQDNAPPQPASLKVAFEHDPKWLK